MLTSNHPVIIITVVTIDALQLMTTYLHACCTKGTAVECPHDWACSIWPVTVTHIADPWEHSMIPLNCYSKQARVPSQRSQLHS